MKKTLILALSVVGAVGAYAQGTVNFSEAGDATSHIYAPQGAGTSEVTGNAANDSPSGAATYAAGSSIGGNSTSTGSTGYGNGNNFTAELYGVSGTTASLASVLAAPLTQYSSTFSTKPGGAGQFLGSSPATDPGISGATGGTGASLSLAAWYNGGGTITTLAAAEAAKVPYGWSPLFTINGPLGNQSTGGPPATPPDLVGLQSFSLIATTTPLPEPGTIALGIMGAAAFLARRRK